MKPERKERHGRHHTKTDVVVEVVDVVIVTVSAAGVPLIIVEGTTAQHTALIGQPRRYCDIDIIQLYSENFFKIPAVPREG